MLRHGWCGHLKRAADLCNCQLSACQPLHDPTARRVTKSAVHHGEHVCHSAYLTIRFSIVKPYVPAKAPSCEVELCNHSAMAMTALVKSELATIKVTKPCDRKSEVACNAEVCRRATYCQRSNRD